MQWAPKQWMRKAGDAIRNPGQTAGRFDQMVANQAEARMLRNARSGDARNVRFLRSQPAETVYDRLQSDGVTLPGAFGFAAQQDDPQRAKANVIEMIGAEGNRRGLAQGLLASGGIRSMHRGPFGQRGLMEAINQGIATNTAVRRGVLPTAVVGGGLMGGAAVTEGAQQLMALMGFMQQGEQTRERAENSPIAQA